MGLNPTRGGLMTSRAGTVQLESKVEHVTSHINSSRGGFKSTAIENAIKFMSS